MSDKDGGPAFPSTSYWDARVEEMRPPDTAGGMTLRDYFAAHCPDDFIKNACEVSIDEAARAIGVNPASYHPTTHYHKLVAKRCYEYADAMLKEREK